MKSRAALVLSITGILFIGSAALAVNTYTLNGTHASTLGNAGNVLLPNPSDTTTPAPDHVPTNPVASPKAAPKTPSEAGSGNNGVNRNAAPSKKPSPAPAPTSNQASPVTVQPDPGRGATIATQPGDDKGGLRGGGSGGHGSDD